jgi:hypothetical protein
LNRRQVSPSASWTHRPLSPAGPSGRYPSLLPPLPLWASCAPRARAHTYVLGLLTEEILGTGSAASDEHSVAWGESKLRSDRVKAAVQRNAEAGRRTSGGSRPFGYEIIYHDLGEASKRQRRIIREELEPAEADAVREAVSRVLKGESLRSIAFDFNKRGIKPAGGKKNGESKIDKWQGSTCGAC